MIGYPKVIRILILLSIFATILSGTPVMGQEGTPPVATPTLASQPAFDFRPIGDEQSAFFDVEVLPGDAVSLSVLMANGGSEAFEAVTYKADAYSIRNGGFGLLEMGTEPTGPTTWLDYPEETFLSSVDNPLERAFTISVPEGTAAGEYVTGIAMQTADPINDEITEGMFRYDQYYRTVVGIRIRVPGVLQAALDVGAPEQRAEGSVYGLVLPISNTGNQQAKPSGELRVLTESDDLVLSAPVTMGNIYGGHETELWIGLAQPLPAGTYSVDLDLADPDKNVAGEWLGMTLTVEESELADQSESLVAISSVSMVPLPSTDDVQFITVDAVISNLGEPVSGAQLSLVAYLDGVEVERFPISQSLALPEGDTPVTTRFFPLTGWASGTWTFELLLEDVQGSAAIVIGRQPLEGSVVIP